MSSPQILRSVGGHHSAVKAKASLDLSEADRAALAGLLRETIERDRFPASPRVR